MPASMVQGRARPPAGGQIRRWSRLALLAGVLVLLQAAWAAGPRPGPAAGSMEGRAAPAGPVIGRPDRPGHGQGWASLGPHRVRYQIHRGRALAEGDIDLGDAAALRRREARGGVGSQGLAVPGPCGCGPPRAVWPRCPTRSSRAARP